MRRQYKKCEWRERTVDITNVTKDFCKQCLKYENYQEFLDKEFLPAMQK